jgi:hypothetical protein
VASSDDEADVDKQINDMLRVVNGQMDSIKVTVGKIADLVQARRGDAGPEGPEGPEGRQGVKGDRGEQGPKGDKGDRGSHA